MNKIIQKIEKNSYVRVITVIAVVLGAFITIVSFFGGINEYLYDNVFLSKNISDKVDELSAGQSINYFKQLLGAEKLQRDVSEKYTEYIFEYKSSFIQTLVNKQNNEVIYWAITYCGKSPIVIERPIFKMAQQHTGEKDIFGKNKYEYSFGDKLLLNKSTIKDIFKNEKGDFRYFISGATANSFAYESLYLGNPSAYQTVIVGVNDICSTDDSFYNLGAENNASQEDIELFRRKSRVNTYAETSPFYGEEVLKLFDSWKASEPFINFGVDRIRVRYFNE